MKTGIIGALPEEIQFLLQELRHSGKKVTETRRGSMEFTEGEIRNNAVVVCRCGVGKVHAAMCAQILISEFGVTRIINTGAAGALDSRLSLFDIVVSTEAVQHDFNVTPFGYEPACIPGFNSPFFVADPDLREVAKKDLSVSLPISPREPRHLRYMRDVSRPGTFLSQRIPCGRKLLNAFSPPA